MGWLRRYRGALLTWVLVLVGLFGFGNLVLAAILTLNYHPNAPGAYKMVPLQWIGGLGLLALVGLSVLHGTKPRRDRFGRNVGDLAAVFGMVAAAATMVVVFVNGPEYRDIRAFGATYRIASVYRPGLQTDDQQNPLALTIEICENTFAPIYAPKGDCSGIAIVRWGQERILDEFSVDLALREAGAKRRGDVLTDPGRHKTDADTGALIYRDGLAELRLSLDGNDKVLTSHHCYRRHGLACAAAVRRGPMTLFFPIADKDARIDVQAARWHALFDSWRCPDLGECVYKGLK